MAAGVRSRSVALDRAARIFFLGGRTLRMKSCRRGSNIRRESLAPPEVKCAAHAARHSGVLGSFGRHPAAKICGSECHGRFLTTFDDSIMGNIGLGGVNEPPKLKSMSQRGWAGQLNARRLPAKILSSISTVFMISVAVRWGPQSAQIEKSKGETHLVGPFYIGFRRKKWVLGVF